MNISVVTRPDGVVVMRVGFVTGAIVSFFFENAGGFHEFVMGALKCDREISPDRFPEAEWGGEMAKFILDVLK
jgi:hypothetical protein